MTKKKTTSAKMFNQVTGDVDREVVAADNMESGRFKSPEQYKKVKDILERFAAMQHYRQTSCPWYGSAATLTEDSDSGNMVRANEVGSGGDSNWSTRWQRDRDLYMMKTGKNKYDIDLPEVSSPIVFAPAQAAIAQFQDANTTVFIESQPGVDPTIARIATEYIRSWEQSSGTIAVKHQLFREACVCGTAISYNGRVTKKRKVKLMKTVDDIMSEMGFDDDQMDQEPTMDVTGQMVTPMQAYQAKEAEILDQIKKDPLKMLTREETITDFDDNVIEMVPLEEIYVDPGAESFNGITRDARDCIWVQYVSVQQVFAMFENSDDAFVLKDSLNKDLILSSGAVIELYDDSDDQRLEKLLKSQAQSDLVCLVKYYNKMTDQYIILANDILVRDGPLPYNHKLLPFSKYTFIPNFRNFYGVGFGTLLDTVQQKDEQFQSLEHYIAEFNANLPMTYVSDNGELEQSLNDLMESGKPLKKGVFIKAGANESVTPMQAIQTPYDLNAVRDKLLETSIKITGVNPLMNSLPSGNNVAVRNNQLIQENSLLLIRMAVSNVMMGYADAIKQILMVAKQLEPVSYEESEEYITRMSNNQQVTEALKKKNYRKINMKGIAFNDEGSIEENSQGGLAEMTPALTDNFDRLQVSVSIETVALASRQLQAQQLSETLDKVMLVRSNPALAQDKLVSQVFKDFLDKRGVDPKYFSFFEDENSDESDILADYQNEQMKAGNFEPPLSGMSENHRQKHALLLVQLLMEEKTLNKQLKQAEGMIDPMAVQQGLVDPGVMQQLQSLSDQQTQLADIISAVQEHLVGDMQAKTDSDMSAVTMAKQSQQAGMPPMPDQGQLPAPQGDPSQMPVEEQQMAPVPAI